MRLMMQNESRPGSGGIQASHIPQRVADHLREQILSGRLADGEILPKEADLRADYRVGRPAMREAMRILEAEGLLRVLRGNRGGAVVRSPRTDHSAYALGLVMKARGVETHDIAAALRELEPICAGLCAQRPDRMSVVVEPLERIQEATERQMGDPRGLTVSLRAFHERLVSSCGNDTLVIIIGALESLWSSHIKSSWLAETPQRGEAELRQSIADHAVIIGLIRKGDVNGAQDAVRRHLTKVQSAGTPANRNPSIDLQALRSTLGL